MIITLIIAIQIIIIIISSSIVTSITIFIRRPPRDSPTATAVLLNQQFAKLSLYFCYYQFICIVTLWLCLFKTNSSQSKILRVEFSRGAACTSGDLILQSRTPIEPSPHTHAGSQCNKTYDIYIYIYVYITYTYMYMFCARCHSCKSVSKHPEYLHIYANDQKRHSSKSETCNLERNDLPNDS